MLTHGFKCSISITSLPASFLSHLSVFSIPWVSTVVSFYTCVCMCVCTSVCVCVCQMQRLHAARKTIRTRGIKIAEQGNISSLWTQRKWQTMLWAVPILWFTLPCVAVTAANFPLCPHSLEGTWDTPSVSGLPSSMLCAHCLPLPLPALHLVPYRLRMPPSVGGFSLPFKYIWITFISVVTMEIRPN